MVDLQISWLISFQRFWIPLVRITLLYSNSWGDSSPTEVLRWPQRSSTLPSPDPYRAGEQGGGVYLRCGAVPGGGPDPGQVYRQPKHRRK